MARFGFPFRSKKAQAAAAVAAPADAVIESEDEDRYRPIQWPLVKRLLESLAPFKKLYITAIALGLCQVLLDMQAPEFTQRIIDYGADYAIGKFPGITKFAASWHIVSIIGWWTLVFIGSVILQRYTILLMTRTGGKRAVRFSPENIRPASAAVDELL